MLFENFGKKDKEEQARYKRRLLFFMLIVALGLGLFVYNMTAPQKPCIANRYLDCGPVS